MEEYVRGVLQKVVAKTCQSIGFDSVTSTSLDFMTDLTDQYLKEISKKTQGYAELFGRTNGNLDDIGLAFRDLNIKVEELAQYVEKVESIECPVAVPKLPIVGRDHIFFPEIKEEPEPEKPIGSSPQMDFTDYQPDHIVPVNFNHLDALDEEIQSYIPEEDEFQKNMERWIWDDLTLPTTPTIPKTPEIRSPSPVVLIQQKKEEIKELATKFAQEEEKKKPENSNLPKAFSQNPLPSILPYDIPCYNSSFPKPIFPLSFPVAASASPPMIPSLPTSALLSNPSINPKDTEMLPSARIEPKEKANKSVENEKVIEEKKMEEKRKLDQEEENEFRCKMRKFEELIERMEERERKREQEKIREVQEREAEIQKEMEKKQEKEKEKQRENERDRERHKKRKRERERERQRERERERERKIERQKEMERQREREIERQKEREIHSEMEIKQQREVERQKKKEREKEWQKQTHSERQKEKKKYRQENRKREREEERKEQMEENHQKTMTPVSRVPPLKIVKLKPLEKAKETFVATWCLSSSQQEEKLHYFDENGVEIWICPNCKKQDDGSLMIGCDECDLWYHLICTELSESPPEEEKWYCQSCSAKRRQHNLQKYKKNKLSY